MHSSPPLPPPDPGAEFERHFRWRWLAMVGFLGLMLGLAAVALASLLIPPRILAGIPDDPDARAAWAIVSPGLEAGLLDLRLESGIGVSTRPEGRVRLDHLRRAERADSLLKRALARHPDDPRILSAIGHLDLVRQRPNHAVRRYRAALDAAPHHDEARLGLGVAFARLAELEPDPFRARRLELRAIAQFAAVRPTARERLAADYDRAVLLEAVHRAAQARRFADLYLDADSTSGWAERLRARVPGA